MSKLDGKREQMSIEYMFAWSRCVTGEKSSLMAMKKMHEMGMPLFQEAPKRIPPWNVFCANKPEVDKRRYKRWERKMQFKDAKTVEVVTVK